MTLGAFLGSLSIEMKVDADRFLLSELKRDIPCYLTVSEEVIVIVSNPEEGILTDLACFLKEIEASHVVWVVEI